MEENTFIWRKLLNKLYLNVFDWNETKHNKVFLKKKLKNVAKTFSPTSFVYHL